MRILSIIFFAVSFFTIKYDASANEYRQKLTNEYMNQCILKGIKSASENYQWVSGRGLSKTCACFANNYVMGLKEESCDKTSPIRDRDVKEYFDVK